MKFEWDPQKAKTNLKRHRASFDEAVEVFFDARAVELYDAKRSSATEAGFQIIGFSSRRLLFVVFVDLTKQRSGETTYRIISARNAEKDEQEFHAQVNQES